MELDQETTIRRQERCYPGRMYVATDWRDGDADRRSCGCTKRTPREELYDEVCHALSVLLVEGPERADSADAD